MFPPWLQGLGPPIPEFIPPPWFQGPQPVGPMPPPPPMFPPWLQGLGPPMPIPPMPPPPLGGIIGPPRPPLIQGPDPPLMFMGGPFMPPLPPRENGAPRKLPPRIGLPPRGTKPGAPLAPLKLPLGPRLSFPRNFLFFLSSCFFPKPFSFATLLYCSTIFLASSLSSSTKVGTTASLSSSGRAKFAFISIMASSGMSLQP